MIRATTLFLLIATAAVAGTLFWLKHVVTGLEDELQTRQQELLQEQEAIHVLKAEWAYLNRPDRLARLAAQYLHLVPVKGVQLTSLSAIPWPLEKTEPRPSFKPGTPAPMPHTPALPAVPVPMPEVQPPAAGPSLDIVPVSAPGAAIGQGGAQ